jgi:hypothetical protein
VQEALAVSAEGTPLLVDEELGEEGKDSGR